MTFNLFSVLERPALLPTRYTTAIKFQTRKQPSLFVILPSLRSCYVVFSWHLVWIFSPGYYSKVIPIRHVSFTMLTCYIIFFTTFSHSYSLYFLQYVDLLVLFFSQHLIWIFQPGYYSKAIPIGYVFFTTLACYIMCSWHLAWIFQPGYYSKAIPIRYISFNTLTCLYYFFHSI